MAAQGRLAQGVSYTADLVFCIDATGSMEDFSGGQTKIINMVKKNALNLYSDVYREMEAKSKKLEQLRVRVIIFRDFLADGEYAMLGTDFFKLPEQTAEFEACIQSIKADGGGDIPEDGLEALAYAMRSDWATTGSRRRQVIVVWTDAGTHPLGYGKSSPYYPKGMPKTMAELGAMWDELEFNAKRLVMFAPDANYWNYITDNWDNVVHVPSVAGGGLAEQTYQAILEVIVNSI